MNGPFAGSIADGWPRCRHRRRWWMLAAGLFMARGAQAQPTFSQYPGFAEYFAAHPRVDRPATAEERILLERYRPRLYVGADAEGPLSFYDDYIAQGILVAADGSVISARVDRPKLNAHRNDPGVVFRHVPPPGPVRPVAFARADYDALPGVGRLTFLTWHFVFRVSGLPAGMTAWQEWALRLLADLDDWHQLDHYTAATLVLDERRQPFALILQQHNHQRSYVLRADVDWPADERICLVSALRSNELYPCAAGRQRHRTVPFMTEEGLRYLVLGTPRPRMSADDITEAGREVGYRLDFLPLTDAFYTFAGRLGERRRLPGRDGPPGADYKALPLHMRPAVQLAAFNWREGDVEQLELLRAFMRNPAPDGSPFRALVERFSQRLGGG